MFQSTHPCGVRQKDCRHGGGYDCRFNPRTPAGCDIGVDFDGTIVLSVSIHAPLRGATGECIYYASGLEQFQSTHPCGVRSDEPLVGRLFNGVSIHAPLPGATSVCG